MTRFLMALLLCSPVFAVGQAPIADVHECDIGPLNARCGTMTVWENRETRVGRKIPIKFVVLPAASEHAAPDPVFTLNGGPGVASTAGIAELVQIFAFYTKRRDFVVMDQRGIGGSNDLNCGDPPPNAPVQELMASLAARAKQCLIELQGRGDLTQYHALNIIEDIEDLRVALGYGRINLHGLSYGTRLEQLYARKYPQHVRSITMEGPLALLESIPAELPADSQTALDDLFTECASDPKCHGAFPELRRELDSLLAQLKRKPQPIEIDNPVTHRRETLTIDYPMAAQAIRSRVANAEDASKLPIIIHQAAQGTWEPLGQATLSGRIGDKNFSFGMWLSATCSEDFPFIPKSKYVATPQYYFPTTAFSTRKQHVTCGRKPSCPPACTSRCRRISQF
jgi:pimeloyl-ACP methyl ester carboxylesterase